MLQYFFMVIDLQMLMKIYNRYIDYICFDRGQNLVSPKSGSQKRQLN